MARCEYCGYPTKALCCTNPQCDAEIKECPYDNTVLTVIGIGDLLCKTCDRSFDENGVEESDITERLLRCY